MKNRYAGYQHIGALANQFTFTKVLSQNTFYSWYVRVFKVMTHKVIMVTVYPLINNKAYEYIENHQQRLLKWGIS